MYRHRKFNPEEYQRFKESHRFYHSYMHRMHHMKQYRHRDFALSHKSLKFLRPVFLLLIILLIYMLIYFPVNKILTFLLGLFIIGHLVHFVWISHLEKRIFKPILQLHDGVKEIAKGNYNVRIDNNACNEIGFLIESFNIMAEKLKENENLKQEYEENRKALIANISHDLKTPITAIQGYIEAIQDGIVTSPEKMAQYLEIINNNTVYINHLIDDLFLFSKLDMHQLEFKMESVPIKAYMHDLMTEFSFELQERGFEFHYTDDMAEKYNVVIDRKRIYQVIRNIIGNAIKYGPPGALRLETRLYKSEGFSYLTIRDNGPGIPEDKLPRIFDRFYRVDSERTKDLMSTGLGLSIAKELVEAHGGKVLVESVVGEGSCFTLAIPLSTEKGSGHEAYSDN
ncbi:HAMP domain-containing sensor histidine kinase [Desulforamulus aquiferis]|nr:HAMP domain-containing sensor histidine kinase [Desulforamulus aquiferis]